MRVKLPTRYRAYRTGCRRLESIQGSIQPIYVRTAPLEDAWGHPLLYWSDGERYVLVSTGADGKLDSAWEAPAPEPAPAGESDDPDADIVFADGQFLQWPGWAGR